MLSAFWRRPLHLISATALQCVLVLLASGAFAAGAPPTPIFLSFSALEQDDTYAVVANHTIIIRLRQGDAAHLASVTADKLNVLALQGLRAGEVSVRGSKAGAVLLVKDVPLLTIDSALARSGKSTPRGLAKSWADNLKRVLGSPYIALSVKDQMLVPLGESREIKWGGTAAAVPVFASLAPEIATLQVEATARVVHVRGLGRGATVVAARLGEAQSLITVKVKPWAARVQPQATATISAPPLPASDLRRVLRNAALMATTPAPGASISLGEPQYSANGYTIAVHACGPDLLTVSATVSIAVATIAPPRQTTPELLVSNLPEKITEPATLLRQTLALAAPVRLLWHHVNCAGRPLRYVIRLANRDTRPAAVHLTEAATGPYSDEIFVGHAAMVRFLRLKERGAGYVLNVPPGRMVDLYDVRLPDHLIVSGLARITPLESRDLVLEVAAESFWPPDAYFLPVPDRLRHDPPLTPYEFEAQKSVELKQEVGGPWTFYNVGKHCSVNLEGQKLFGDYGVCYQIKVTFWNPNAAPARAEIAVRASGGVARCTFLIEGDLVETGLLAGGSDETIYRTSLSPGETKTISLSTMPESGSNYPVTLVLRSSQEEKG